MADEFKNVILRRLTESWRETQLSCTEPNIIPRAKHCVSRANISKNALKVLYRLADAGFESFLVGGSVRDLLLNRRPKDFDVATSASPEEVRSLFRNCRLIGRRFRLAHIHFADDIIEVATFRGGEASPMTESVSDQGRILRDNTYGTIHTDVWRRDFTVNALYYNIRDFTVWDYVGGVEDVRSGTLRLLGEPEQRYREDPVRMLRAARFAAKLDFDLEHEAGEAIAACQSLLQDVPAARKFEEVLKLFLSGHASASLRVIQRYGLLDQIFPGTAKRLGEDQDATQSFLDVAMQSTDQRVADGKSVTPFFLFAVLLWPVVEKHSGIQEDKGARVFHALQVAATKVLQEQQAATSIPRRIIAPMREMMALQPRMLLPQGRRTWGILRHPRFRAAYDLLCLRGAAGQVADEKVQWWTRIQQVNSDEQREMVRVADPGGVNKKRRRRRRRRGPRQSRPAET